MKREPRFIARHQCCGATGCSFPRICSLSWLVLLLVSVTTGQDHNGPHCDASGGTDSHELQPMTSTGGRRKMRLLVIRTHRCASTAFGGWILRAVHASHGRLEAYRAEDGEVARTGVTAWAAHANAILDHRTVGPLPAEYVPYPNFPRGEQHTGTTITGDVVQDADSAAISSHNSTLIVAFILLPPS